jgi:hypothetical protein
MDDSAKSEFFAFGGGILIASLLAGGLNWYILGMFMAPGHNDPLTKAGGLRPSEFQTK